MTFNITEAVEKWREYRKSRLELEDLAKKIKNGPEAQMRAAILMYLDSQGMNGSKTAAGTVSKTSKDHLEVVDTEALLRFMLSNMITALKEGRPLADALILQKTPLKSGITELVRQRLDVDGATPLTDEQFNGIAAQFGIKRVSEPDISFSKNS